MDRLPVSTFDVIESAVQSAVMVAMGYVALRTALGPDRIRIAQAQLLRQAEDYCQRQATGWANMADACKTAYDRTRLVV